MSKLVVALVCLVTLAASSARADLEVVRSGDDSLDVGGMGQFVGAARHLVEPDKDNNGLYLFLQTARLRVNGSYAGYRFHLQLATGGDDALAVTSAVGLGLLDFNVDVPLPALDRSFFKVGQFLVPYGREQLVYPSAFAFGSPSLDQGGFVVGRDVGATFNLREGKLLAIVGVFTGGGRDVPPTWIPESLGVPLLAARAGYGDIDDDPYSLASHGPKFDRARWGVFASGLYTKDSLMGHSSVLNVKLADKSLLLNANWNPFIAKQPLVQGEWWQLGADAAVRAPLTSNVGVEAEAQADWAGYSNAYGAVHLGGARAQGAVTVGRLSFALRYAVLLPDASFAFATKTEKTPITGTEPIHEITPAVTYAFDDRVKLVFDVPVTLDAPVVNEPKVGSYLATQMPNQTTVLGSGGSVARQNVEQARLVLQARF